MSTANHTDKCLIQITEEEIDGKGVKMVHDIHLLSWSYLLFQNNIIYSVILCLHTMLASGRAHCFGCEVDSSGRHTPVAPADFRECRKFMTSHLRASHLENSQKRQGKTGRGWRWREKAREKVKRQAKKATPACNLTHRPHPSSLLQEFWDSTAG